MRDGAHGLLVWATGALLGAVLAASGITGVVGAAGRASGTVAQTAAEAVGGDVDYLAERLVRGVNGIDPEVRGAVAATIRRSLASGEFAPQDRDYLAGLLADGTGQTPEEAAAIIDFGLRRGPPDYDAAIEKAEQARVAAAIGAFLVAATLLASGAAAYMAAATGGDHRDRGVRFGG